MSSGQLNNQQQLPFLFYKPSHTIKTRRKVPAVGRTRAVKTEPNENQRQKPTKYSMTENVTEGGSESGQSRKLSRIIYRHLQKKIEHEEIVYEHRKIADSQGTITQRGSFLPDLKPPQKRSQTEQARIQQFGKPMWRLKYLLRNQHKSNISKLRQSKAHRTDIDAYFDLSCLSTVPKNSSHHKYQRY